MALITQTERLKIRYVTLDDVEPMFRLYNSEGFLTYIGDRNIRSIADCEKALLDGPIKMYEDHGFGLFAVEDRQTGEFLGICGLIKRDELDDVDLGYGFLPEAEGKGYATESSRAMVDYAKDHEGLNSLVAITQSRNTGSIKVLEKVGMHFEKEIEVSFSEMPLMLYRIDF